MSENTKQDVNTSSVKFKQGVEAGLNSAEDSKNWQAGNELGQELKDESVRKEAAPEDSNIESSTPLFMRAGASADKGNAQDEKDESEE